MGAGASQRRLFRSEWLLAAVACLQLMGCQSLRHVESREVHWFRDSAEQQADYLQTYAAAEAAVRKLSAGLPSGSWGVILDVDETVLDNSDYQKERDLAGQTWDARSWTAWVHSQRARVLPGAAHFVKVVREELHGQVVLVTNRLEAVCEDTRANLSHEDVHFDRILCDDLGDQDKNARFRRVLDGTAGGPRPLNVLVWIGDNIRDFPLLTQHSPDLSAFGQRYFMLPNPMYGSWEGNAQR